MRKKLLIVSVLAAAMLGLTSCGSKSNDAAKSVEAVQNVDETEVTSEEIEQQSETAAEETSTEAVAEESDNGKQDSGEVVWYMDSEGLKSDELGIIIRKDSNAREHVLGLVKDLQGDVRVYCDYYDGDIDAYISEYTGDIDNTSEFPIGYGPYMCLFTNTYYLGDYDMQKASVDDVEYAYILDDDHAFAVFVGNGIAVSVSIRLEANETIEDCMNRIWNEAIGLCDEFDMDCMAYMADDGIYCPALGMKFTGRFKGKQAICFKESLYGEEEECIEFQNSLPRDIGDDVQDAKDAVEKCVESAIAGFDDTLAGETETRDFGKCTYYEKGYTITSEWGFGNGHTYFCSDDTEWFIDFRYYKDGENYIDCIESLE